MSNCKHPGCKNIIDNHYHTTKGIEFSRMEKIEEMVAMGATIKALEAERDALRAELSKSEMSYRGASSDRDRLEKECDRYKKALKEIVSFGGAVAMAGPIHPVTYRTCSIAQEALAAFSKPD